MLILRGTVLLFKTQTVKIKTSLEKLRICKTASAVRQTNIQGFTYSLWLLSHHM